ncbi:hypothetical protein MMC31_005379 [Peltigera leucophlebia]|nr:hypothetical protein [Peltigera leucophlebia]
MSSSNTASGDQLKTALGNFEAVLTHEQKTRLQSIAAVPDATAVIVFTTKLDNENAKRGSRCVATRLLTFLQSIQQFTTVVDTFGSSNPAIPALVWGSVKLAVLLTSNNASYFDKLSALLMSFKEPRAFWRPFKPDELGRFEKEIRKCKSEVDAEISRALHQSIFQEQQLQLIERKAAAGQRDLGSIFRVRVDKSNEEERRWRIQSDKRQARSRKQDLLDRLSNYDHMTPLRRASRKRHGQTADWLRESAEFANWMADPKSNIFILSGKLGSGKTVTTACTVGHLFAKSGSDYQVVYFFCQFDNAESLRASIILSALIRQLLDTKILPESIETCLVNLLKVPCPEARDLGVLLKDLLVITKCSFIFIDAIDECAKSEWEVLLEVLQDILISCSSVVKVFLAVRQGIVEEMENVCEWHYQTTMSSSEVNSNIKIYIEDVLAEKKDSGKLVVDNPELINEITDALVEGANGMFLWVFYQIEDICRQICDHDIRKKIRKLPKKLPETYDGILSRITRLGNARLAEKVFLWVATARRPLLLEELREAMAIEPLQPYSDRERLINDMSQIVSCCESLIVLDEQDTTVQFTHQTVRMFLLDGFRDQVNANFHFEQRESNHYLGEICVTYLNFNDFQRKLIRRGPPLPTPEAILEASLSADPGKSVWKKVAGLRKLHRGYTRNPTHVVTGTALHNSLGSLRGLQTEHPFLSYAAKYWLHHCADFKKTKTQTWHLWEESLLSEYEPATMPWEYSELSQRTRTVRRWICDQEHVALLSLIESSETPFAEAEMQCILNFAIEKPSLRLFDAVFRECHSSARVLNESLIIAVGGGYLWALDKLLAEGADPNWRTLGSAHRRRDSHELQLSMTNAEIDATSGKYVGLTALQAAAKGGYIELVDKLITAKANINAEAYLYSGRTALQAAAQEGHFKVIGKLLRAKANVNAKASDHSGRTALQAAAEKGHLEVVERLLTAKANVNAGASYNSGRTALQAAAEKGHLEVVERLLTAKADVNAKPGDDCGRTALQAAAEQGHLEMVERLLTVKADVNAKPGEFYGRTAFQAAAEQANLEMVERFLTAKADVNAGAGFNSGRTALQAAAEQGHLEMVERLLTAKADVNAEAGKYSGRTALQSAAEKGHLEMVERLLTAKADVNAKACEYYGRTALQAAAEREYLTMVERLLTAKADVNAEESNYFGRTALQAAAEMGHLEVVERLLTVKAHVNAGAGRHSGRTALQAAAEKGRMDVVKMLLTAKADVNAKPGDDSGRTALQATAEQGNLEMVERFLTAKADVNAGAGFNSGRTALQAAAEHGHLEMVERLLTAKADVNAKPGKHSGRTALQSAAEKGHLEMVERLLTANADVNAKPGDYCGRTALQAAAEKGHFEVVERLLTAKADVNAGASYNSGRTALQAAAEQGHLEVVESLLTAKADVNAKPGDDYGRTALQAAAEKGHLEVVERLLTAKARVNAGAGHHSGRTALQAAAEKGHLEMVERLLTAKADVNAKQGDDCARTALQAAAEQGHLEVVERLLTAKADVNAKPGDYRGRTALQAAAEQGHLEIVERLLTAKADVNAKPSESHGRTALQAAAEKGHIEVVERLLTAKADVNAKAAKYDGRTALQAAAEKGHLEMVERLLTAEADVNAEEGLVCGRTALQAAAEQGNLEMVERFLTAKADVNTGAGYNSGRTALQAAAEKGRIEVVERLLTAKADVNAKAGECFGRTALQAAAKKGHMEVVERLLTAKVAQMDIRAVLQAAKEKRDDGIIKLLESAVHKS